MTYRQFNLNNRPSNPGGMIMGILIAVLVMWGLFKLTSFVFTILMYLTPVLLIATAILDFNTLKGYGKNIGKLFSQNTVVGVLAIVATVIGFPFISAYLFAKALLKKKERDAQEKAAKGPIVGDYVKFPLKSKQSNLKEYFCVNFK